MAKLGKFDFSLGLLKLGSVLIFAIPAMGSEQPLLMFARSFGRYNLLQLWKGPQNMLVGVNDCEEDMFKDISEHIWKGDYRNPVIDNITDYDISQAEVALYNNQDEVIFKLEDCGVPNITEKIWSCSSDDEKYTLKMLDKQGGMVAEKDGGNDKKFIVFNPRHYFSDPKLVNGIKIVIPLRSEKSFLKTGYISCLTAPTGHPANQTSTGPMSIDICFNWCKDSDGDTFGIQTNKCYCKPNSNLHEKNQSACEHLCCNDNNHFCGIENETSIAVYSKSLLSEFKDFIYKLPYNNLEQVRELIRMSENNTSHMLQFNSITYVSKVEIKEEEECTLTNIVFNLTGEEQLPQYELTYTMECSEDERSWKMFDDELWGQSLKLKASTKHLQLGLLKLKCLRIKAKESNITYPRANITFYGPTGDYAEVAGIVFRANYTPLLESSSISSMIESSFEISETLSMEMTEMTDSLMTVDETIDETILGTTMVDIPTTSTDIKTTTMLTTAMTTSSAVVPTPSKTEACMCRCKTEDPVTSENKTLDDVKNEKVAKIKKHLKVDTKDLTATKMKKESAQDIRTSAQVGGYVGIILLVMVVGMMLMADITSIFQHAAMLKANIKQQ